jgi:hypothetical protein
MKQSAILVMLTEPLDSVPAIELDALRRLLFQRVRGLDDDHQRRWLRFWKRLTSGEVAEFYPVVDRAGPYHARHMAIEGRIFENQDGFPASTAGRRAFRNWIKVGASLVRLEIDGDEPRWLPGSCSYEELSDDEMREFHEAAMDWMHTPRALKKLWPEVKPADRLQMLETLLANPTEETQ